MKYSFNLKDDDFSRAISHDVNASYKDLGAVCDAIRYKRASEAVAILEGVISQEHPIAYLRHNKHMGSRHEIGGRKGGYPKRAASEVMKTLVNAMANAGNKGRSGADQYVVAASANKTRIERRYPSKGSIAWGRGMYGMSAINHSDIEYAKIEIVLADDLSDKLTKNMRYFIKKRNKPAPAQKAKPKQEAKPKAQTQAPKPELPKPTEHKKEEPKKVAEASAQKA